MLMTFFVGKLKISHLQGMNDVGLYRDVCSILKDKSNQFQKACLL